MLRDNRQHMMRFPTLPLAREEEAAPEPVPGPLEGPALQFHQSANSMYIPLSF